MINTAKEILGNKKIQRFVLSSLILLLIWVFFTAFFPITLQKIHYWTIYPQAYVSAWLLQIFGYKVSVFHYINNCLSLLDINESALVCVGTGCSGVELFLIFAVFIFLFKGISRNWLWFIPVGIVLISFLNILRIIGLSFISLYAPDYLEFNHKYTFTIIVYGFLIGLWLYWMNKYYDKK